MIVAEPGPNDGWRRLYYIGSICALTILLLMPIQLVIYAMVPPPSNALGFFQLFRSDVLSGLLSLDLLYMVSVTLAAIVMLAVCAALFRTDRSLIAVAMFLITIATATYFASTIAFEMWQLSDLFYNAASESQRAAILAVGDGMIATYKGTAYDFSYVVTAIAGIVVAAVMFRSELFGRTIAITGLAMNLLGLVPSTAGSVGMFLAFGSLVPTALWLGLVTRRLFILGHTGDNANGVVGR